MTLNPAVNASARVAGSTSSDDWQTPPAVLERVRRVRPIGLDPCGSPDNPTGAQINLYPPRDDGLTVPWHPPAFTLVYVNPPYSTVAAWASKVVREAAADNEIISLVAARPDSRWFFSMVWETATAVCFWKGRLRFVGAPASAPFPSAVVYHGPRSRVFESAFREVGRVVRL